MPAPASTLKRIEQALPAILQTFGTPCYVYDERGMMARGDELLQSMSSLPTEYRQYFAVKACNNPEILKIQRDKGFGFDCSSPYELSLVKRIGVHGENRVMFTSNNSRPDWFHQARNLGAILNLDDVSLIPKVKEFPDLIFFRLNPGSKRTGNSIIGNPVEAKYGIMWEQMLDAYRSTRQRGASRFGLHTMICSNCLDEDYLVSTVKMLLQAISEVGRKLQIEFEAINMGGGFGITYHPEDAALNIRRIANRVSKLIVDFRETHGYAPKLFTELGRWMTGPFGFLVTKVINRKEIYQTHVGVDVGMEGLMRPAVYGSYHHITVFKPRSRNKREVVNVVGSICENRDRLATQRELPMTKEGDILIVHDAGAHGLAMCFNYNGKTRPQEIIVRTDGTAELIRRAETEDDLDLTLTFQKRSAKR